MRARQLDHPYLDAFLLNVCIGAGIMVGIFGVVGLTELVRVIW